MDLYEPGSGLQNQLHDFNGGIAPSGLFWTVPIPADALQIDAKGAHLHLENERVVDSFQILGPNSVPGTVSLDVTWVAKGSPVRYTPGSSAPADPSNFAAEFRPAIATGSFSGSEEGFRFSASGASSEGIFAELGTERNGWFLDHSGNGAPDAQPATRANARDVRRVGPSQGG